MRKSVSKFVACGLALGWMVPVPASADPTLDAAVEQVAREIVSSLEKASASNVAVVSFSNLDGQTSLLGKFLAEELTVSLTTASASSDISVVDRANLERILTELELTASGLVDPENAKKVGQIAGVDAMVLGSLVDFQGSYRWTAKLIDTETARLLGASRATLQATPELSALWGKSGVSVGLSGGGIGSSGPTGQQNSPEAIYPPIRVSHVEMQVTNVVQTGADVTVQATIRNTTTSPVSVYAGDTNPHTYFYFREDLSQWQRLGGHLLSDNGSRFSLLNVSGMQLVDKGDDPSALFKGTNYFITLQGSESASISMEFGARGTDSYSSSDKATKVSGILESRIVLHGAGREVSSRGFGFTNFPISNR